MRNQGAAVTGHSLARHILQAEAKAEASAPLRVIMLDPDARIDPGRASLAEAAPYLRVLEVHDTDDLNGVNVVMIPEGQKHHRLFENAEVRRQSRMLG